jgi:hypothetical protein
VGQFLAVVHDRHVAGHGHGDLAFRIGLVDPDGVVGDLAFRRRLVRAGVHIGGRAHQAVLELQLADPAGLKDPVVGPAGLLGRDRPRGERGTANPQSRRRGGAGQEIPSRGVVVPAH